MTTHEELQRIMDFDHPITVTQDGSVVDAPAGVYAPEVYHVEGRQHPYDVDVMSDQWTTFSVGYTGQHGYNGAVMHASEFIGGQLADDILAQPGIYVVCAVEVLPPDDDEHEDQGTMPAGWTILRWKADAGLGVGHIWTNSRCPAYATLDGRECTCNEGKS